MMPEEVFGAFGVRELIFLMIRRPPRSTQSRSSAASDVYKRQNYNCSTKIVINVVYCDKRCCAMHQFPRSKNTNTPLKQTL